MSSVPEVISDIIGKKWFFMKFFISLQLSSIITHKPHETCHLAFSFLIFWWRGSHFHKYLLVKINLWQKGALSAWATFLRCVLFHSKNKTLTHIQVTYLNVLFKSTVKYSVTSHETLHIWLLESPNLLYIE